MTIKLKVTPLHPSGEATTRKNTWCVRDGERHSICHPLTEKSYGAFPSHSKQHQTLFCQWSRKKWPFSSQMKVNTGCEVSHLIIFNVCKYMPCWQCHLQTHSYINMRSNHNADKMYQNAELNTNNVIKLTCLEKLDTACILITSVNRAKGNILHWAGTQLSQLLSV